MTRRKAEEAENNFDVLALFEGLHPHQVRELRRRIIPALRQLRSEIIAEHLDGREAAKRAAGRREVGREPTASGGRAG